MKTNIFKRTIAMFIVLAMVLPVIDPSLIGWLRSEVRAAAPLHMRPTWNHDIVFNIGDVVALGDTVVFSRDAAGNYHIAGRQRAYGHVTEMGFRGNAYQYANHMALYIPDPIGYNIIHPSLVTGGGGNRHAPIIPAGQVQDDTDLQSLLRVIDTLTTTPTTPPPPTAPGNTAPGFTTTPYFDPTVALGMMDFLYHWVVTHQVVEEQVRQDLLDFYHEDLTRQLYETRYDALILGGPMEDWVWAMLAQPPGSPPGSPGIPPGWYVCDTHPGAAYRGDSHHMAGRFHGDGGWHWAPGWESHPEYGWSHIPLASYRREMGGSGIGRLPNAEHVPGSLSTSPFHMYPGAGYRFIPGHGFIWDPLRNWNLRSDGYLYIRTYAHRGTILNFDTAGDGGQEIIFPGLQEGETATIYPASAAQERERMVPFTIMIPGSRGAILTTHAPIVTVSPTGWRPLYPRLFCLQNTKRYRPAYELRPYCPRQ